MFILQNILLLCRIRKLIALYHGFNARNYRTGKSGQAAYRAS